MSVALCKFVCMSHKMFSEYSSARNFKGIVQKYYTTFLPSAVSQELQWLHTAHCRLQRVKRVFTARTVGTLYCFTVGLQCALNTPLYAHCTLSWVCTVSPGQATLG